MTRLASERTSFIDRSKGSSSKADCVIRLRRRLRCPNPPGLEFVLDRISNLVSIFKRGSKEIRESTRSCYYTGEDLHSRFLFLSDFRDNRSAIRRKKVNLTLYHFLEDLSRARLYGGSFFTVDGEIYELSKPLGTYILFPLTLPGAYGTFRCKRCTRT